MSKYEGLYTFDVDNHRYIPVGQSDGIIDCFDFKHHEPTEPLIKDEKIRKAVRAWAEVNRIEDDERVTYLGIDWKLYYSKVGQASIQFNVPLRIADGSYSIEGLCGGEEE